MNIPITVEIPLDNLSPEAIRAAVIETCVDRVFGVTTRHGTDEDGNEWSREDAPVFREMRDAVSREVMARVADAVAAEVPLTVRDVLSGEFQPMDRWGEKKGTKTTIRDMVHDHATKWLEEAVDAKGQTGYSREGAHRTRLAWLVLHYVDEAYNRELRAVVDGVTAEIKPALRDRLSMAVSETVSRLLGVSK